MQTQFNIPLPAIGIDRINGRQWYIDEADDAHMKQEGFVAMREAIGGKVAYYGQKDSLLERLNFQPSEFVIEGKAIPSTALIDDLSDEDYAAAVMIPFEGVGGDRKDFSELRQQHKIIWQDMWLTAALLALDDKQLYERVCQQPSAFKEACESLREGVKYQKNFLECLQAAHTRLSIILDRQAMFSKQGGAA